MDSMGKQPSPSVPRGIDEEGLLSQQVIIEAFAGSFCLFVCLLLLFLEAERALNHRFTLQLLNNQAKIKARNSSQVTH